MFGPVGSSLRKRPSSEVHRRSLGFMSVMSPVSPARVRVRLPLALEDAELRSVLDSVFHVFGLDLEARVTPAFSRIYGSRWVSEVRDDLAKHKRLEPGAHFSPRDPSAVLAALLGVPEALREVAAKDPKVRTGLENRVSKTRALRNEFYHFSWPDYGIQRVRKALHCIRDCAVKLGLKAVADVDGALERISRLEAGEAVGGPTEADVDELRRQLSEGDTAAARFQDERDDALQEAADSAELAMLYDDERQALAISAQAERRELADRAEAARAAKVDAERRAAVAEELHAAAQEVVEDLSGSVKTLGHQLELARAAAGSPVIDRARPLAAPGQPWTFQRGIRRLTLSVAATDLIDDDHGALGLPDVARRWLALRPSGGRVWVDEDGDACTLLNADLVYLGRLPAPTRPTPLVQAGEVVVLPSRDGRKFTLHLDGRIRDRVGSDRTLSSVIGKESALATGQALLRHFPNGGAFYQRRDGSLTRDVGTGRCLILGHVRELAWFPDLLRSKG